MLMRQPSPLGNMLVRCNNCEYFETVPKPGPSFWYCLWCGWGQCFVCHEQYTLPGSSCLPGGPQKRQRMQYSPDCMAFHPLCQNFRSLKAKIEQAIEEGSRMECPGCGLAGRKDDACTHMSCPKCEMDWCYVCGLSVAECDKAIPEEGWPVEDINLHNTDWARNEKRCPMYLCQILEVDSTWIDGIEQEDDFENDDKCLDNFHRFKTIRKLQDVIEKEGRAAFETVFRHFPSIRNAGYSLEEITNTNTDQLFDRSNYLRTLEEESSADGNNDNGEEEEEEAAFEEVPEEMTRDVLQEEEQVRDAIEASLEDQPGQGRQGGDGAPTGRDESGNNVEDAPSDPNNADLQPEFEEVPEAMTRAVLQENQDMQEAREASRSSTQEDELMRQALGASTADSRRADN